MVAIPMSLAYVIPKKYKAQATVLLTAGRYKKPFMPDEKDSKMSFVQVSMEDVASEVEVILSYPVVSKVVDDLGLDKDIPPPKEEIAKYIGYQLLKAKDWVLVTTGLRPRMEFRDVAIMKLQKKVDVDFVKRTNIITISASRSNPELTASIVNSIVNRYIEHHIKIHGNSHAIEAVERLKDESLAKLTHYEDSLRSLSNKIFVYDLDASTKSLNTKLAEAENKYKLLKSLDAKNLSIDVLSEIVQDENLKKLGEKLSSLEMKKIEVNSLYGPKDLKFINLTEEIKQVKTLINSNYEQSLQTWKALKDSYSKQIEGLYGNKNIVERLEREIVDLKSVYALNQEKYNQIVITNAMDKAEISAVKVVEYATPPSGYSFPNRLILLIISVFFGVIFGVTYIVLLDRLGGKFLSSHDVEALLKLPVISSIPEIKNLKNLKPKEQLVKLAKFLIPLKLKLIGVSQQYPRVLFTSSSEGVGTSTLTKNSAYLTAKELGSQKVLYIEVISSAQKKKHSKGVSALEIISTPQILQQSIQLEDEYFYTLKLLIPEGEIIANEKLIQRIDQYVKDQKFEWVFYCVLANQGDMLFMKFLKMVDTTVLVAGYDLTNQKALQRMVDLIQRENGHILGCLFNKRKDVIPSSIYQLIG